MIWLVVGIANVVLSSHITYQAAKQDQVPLFIVCIILLLMGIYCIERWYNGIRED